MSGKDNTPAIPAQPTHADRFAAKQAAQAKRFGRDRARMLAHVQACIKTAGEAIAAGDVETHDSWLDAANTAMESYRQFVKLSAPKSAPASDTGAVNAG